MENCDLHARHTPVSADDSSTNIEEMKEVQIKGGANFEALSRYEGTYYVGDEWDVY